MSRDMPRRRALFAFAGAENEIRSLFFQSPLKKWELLEVDSFAKARFFLQHNFCHATLVHEELLHREGDLALSWVARQTEAPVVFLADGPEIFARAYRQGAVVCLSRTMVLDHPPLLAAAMEQAGQWGNTFRSQRRTREQLEQCRRHVDRLVNLIWRSTPLEPNTQWFTQRHTIERLDEEINRAERHGHPLTLAVAEVQVKDPQAEEEMGPWTSALVHRSKRRCDVAGQYGLQGFLLLMVHTPATGGVICCRRLKSLLESAVQSSKGPQGPLRAFFGLATSSPEKASTQALLRSAEQNLEAAKAGKDGGVVAD